tara:strand:+ start:6964 stop:7539 length:576 start_codon:yes stop_codon:yes gene_type:complete
MRWLTDIGEIISGLFNSKKESLDELFGIKRIFKIDMGKSFRGHMMSLSTSSGDNKTINFYNRYYGGSVSCSYHVRMDSTNIVIENHTKTPNYISNVLDKVSNTHFPEIIKRYESEHGHLKIVINSANIHFSEDLNIKGLNFDDHYNNIQKIRKLNQVVKDVKQRFRSNDILSMIKKSDDKTMPYQGKYILI